jgi:peptide deformylase
MATGTSKTTAAASFSSSTQQAAEEAAEQQQQQQQQQQRLQSQFGSVPIPKLLAPGAGVLQQASGFVPAAAFGTSVWRGHMLTLERCMHEYDGIGIAAPQVGWPVRVFCMLAPGARDVAALDAERSLADVLEEDAERKEREDDVDDEQEEDEGEEEQAVQFYANPVIEAMSWIDTGTVGGLRSPLQGATLLESVPAAVHESHCGDDDDAPLLLLPYNWFWEGCLSVPGVYGWVQRASHIVIRYQSASSGALRREVLSGDAARVFQHEYDHLDGILFPDRVAVARMMVPSRALDAQHTWAPKWPSKGARNTPSGAFGYEA